MQSCRSIHKSKPLNEVYLDEVVDILRLLSLGVDHDAPSSLV